MRLLCYSVMPGSMPGIHVLLSFKDVDGRDKGPAMTWRGSHSCLVYDAGSVSDQIEKISLNFRFTWAVALVI